MKKKHKNINKKKVKRVLFSAKGKAKRPVSKPASNPAKQQAQKQPIEAQKIKPQKRKMKTAAKVAICFMAAGLVLVAAALVLEAQHFPWGHFFGTASQEAASIPDPSPIKLDTSDKGGVVVSAAPSSETASSPSTPVPASPSLTPSASASQSPSDALPGSEQDTEEAPPAVTYTVLGSLKIPMLEVSQNLLEGAGREMKYGVGHVPVTPMPGQKGNCAIAGHRPYPFLYLDQLKSGDSIVIRTDNTYTYTMFDTLVVAPTETWVLNDIPGEEYTLTLITCTPYPVDSHRLIIRARLTDINGKTPQEFFGVPAPSPSPSPAATQNASPSPGGKTPAVSAAPSGSLEASGAPTASGKPTASGSTSASAVPSQAGAVQAAAAGHITAPPEGVG